VNEIQAFVVGVLCGIPVGFFLLIGLALLSADGKGRRPGHNGPPPIHLKRMPKAPPPPPPRIRYPDQHVYHHNGDAK
jgi:hypothetical protein